MGRIGSGANPARSVPNDHAAVAVVVQYAEPAGHVAVNG
jgi:hypothetical protein